MWIRIDNQDVGSEAAIIERVRNSSLVECSGADNVPRLKHRTEAADVISAGVCMPTRRSRDGNAGDRGGMVGERSVCREA